MWYVYILLCKDNTFYTGITTDVLKRLKRHNSGKACQYKKIRRPVELLYTEEFSTESTVRIRESEIKHFSIENKKRLVKFGLGKRSSLVTARDIL